MESTNLILFTMKVSFIITCLQEWVCLKLKIKESLTRGFSWKGFFKIKMAFMKAKDMYIKEGLVLGKNLAKEFCIILRKNLKSKDNGF